MSKLKVIALTLNEHYRLTMCFVALLVGYVYTNWPVEPMMPKPHELSEVVGMPKYINTSTSDMSGIAFTVGGVLLNCSLGSMSGHGGCKFFEYKVDSGKPARATYFLQPTRTWYRYRVLNSLEQNGKTIMSSEDLHAWYMKRYSAEWWNYLLMMFVILVPLCVACAVYDTLMRRVNIRKPSWKDE